MNIDSCNCQMSLEHESHPTEMSGLILCCHPENWHFHGLQQWNHSLASHRSKIVFVWRLLQISAKWWLQSNGKTHIFTFRYRTWLCTFPSKSLSKCVASSGQQQSHFPMGHCGCSPQSTSQCSWNLRHVGPMWQSTEPLPWVHSSHTNEIAGDINSKSSKTI